MNHKKKHSPAKNKGLYGERLATRSKLRGAKQESNHTAKELLDWINSWTPEEREEYRKMNLGGTLN